MVTNKVRVTVTDGMGRKYVHEHTFDPADCTASVAAKDLIGSAIILRDGDTLAVDFLSV